MTAHLVLFGSPTIEHDLSVFDQTWGLPDPPSIQTITTKLNQLGFRLRPVTKCKPQKN